MVASVIARHINGASNGADYDEYEEDNRQDQSTVLAVLPGLGKVVEAVIAALKLSKVVKLGAM